MTTKTTKTMRTSKTTITIAAITPDESPAKHKTRFKYSINNCSFNFFPVESASRSNYMDREIICTKILIIFTILTLVTCIFQYFFSFTVLDQVHFYHPDIVRLLLLLTIIVLPISTAVTITRSCLV